MILFDFNKEEMYFFFHLESLLCTFDAHSHVVNVLLIGIILTGRRRMVQF